MEQKKVTVPDILRMKAAGERITMVTAYDCPFARLLDEAGVDILLVGDSLGMVVQGQDTTLPVTLDEMVYHTRMVARGRKRALVLGDLPFGSYQASPRRAVESAVRLVKEGGAEAVKLEGGLAMARTIEAIAAIDVPVVGHVGLTPQSVHRMGGHRVQGRRAGHGPGERERVLDHGRARDPDHRHRRGRALRRAGARHARPPRPLDRLDAALRQALHGARPRGGARGRRVRGGGEGRPLPDRGADLRAAGGQGRLMRTILEPRTMQAWADAT